MNLEFRLIELEKRSPFTIAAMDHAIFEECEAGRSPPTLLYHNWEKAVSLAAGQNIHDVNIIECERQGFTIVRLPSGGKAVVHFPDTEFSYSLFIPVEKIDIRKLYEKYCGRIGTALRSLGLPSVVVENNDIFVGTKKIGGNAQRIRQKSLCVMQQGIILYHKPFANDMLCLMHPSLYPARAEAKLDALLTGFSEYSSLSQTILRETMTSHLLEGYRWEKGGVTQRERARIRELEESYKNPYDPKAQQVRGLCWLPAPAYKNEKVVEARV